MKGKKLIFIAFGIVLLAIPLYIMFSSEDILVNGHRHKIHLRAFDPFDPFRGKYLMLNYDTNVECDFDLKEGEPCYITLEKDSMGYSTFKFAAAEKPNHSDYFTSQAEYVYNDFGAEIGSYSSCTFSTNNFSKYFINEDQAERAEDYVIAYQLQSPDKIYVAIRVLDGEVRLEEIFIEEIPLKEFLDKEEKAQQVEN